MQNLMKRGLAVLPATFLVAPCGWAQVAEPANADKTPVASAVLEQVVVTAEKRRANAQKTAISVQAFSGDQLEKEGRKRLDDVMEGLPGVQVQNGATGAVFSIRGLDGGNAGATAGSNAPADISGNPGVAIIIDGVYQTRAEAIRGGMLDVARVEVLRGTQSTNLGGNSLVGAVNLVSNQPVFDHQARGSFELGNYNRQNFTGVFNTPLSDTQALRFAFQTNRRDGYTSSNSDNEDNQILRLKYRWKPSNDINLVLTAERMLVGGTGVNQGNLLYQGYWVPATSANLLTTGLPAGSTRTTLGCVSPPRNTATPQTYATLGCAPTYLFNTIAGGATNFRDRANPWDDGLPANAYQNNVHTANDLRTYSANLDWDLGFATLTAIPSYQTTKRENVGRQQGPTTAVSTLDQATTQLDVRLASPERYSRTFKWLGGWSYLDTSASAGSGFELYPSSGFGSVVATPGATPATYTCPLNTTTLNNANCYIWGYSPEIKQTTQSLYGNATYELLPALRVLGGARWQNDRKSVKSSIFNYLGGTAASADGINFNYPGQGSASWNKFTYRTGLEYDLGQATMAYLTFATGYQPGQVSFDVSQAANPQVVVGASETLKQLTAGVKSRWFDNKLQVNVEAFSSKFKNYALNSGTVLTGINAAGIGTGSCAHPQGTPQGTPATFNAATGVYCAQDTPMPDLSSTGVDVDVAWAMTSRDRFTISAEYLKTKITSATSSTLTSQKIVDSVTSRGGTITAAQADALYNQVIASEQSIVGYRPSNSPKGSLSAAYQHRFTLPDDSMLVPRLQAVYKSAYWTSGQGTSLPITANQPAVQPAYTLWNAYLSWSSADGKLDVSAYVRNLTNEVVLNNLNTGPQPWWSVTLGAPRTYGVTTSVKF